MMLSLMHGNELFSTINWPHNKFALRAAAHRTGSQGMCVLEKTAEQSMFLYPEKISRE